MSLPIKEELRIIVISLSRHRRGGVAAVLSTLAGADFFSERILYHSSCGDGRKISKLYSAVRQWCYFAFTLCRPKPDLLHIHFSSDMSFWRKVPYIYLAVARHIKLLLHVHPSHFWDYLHRRSALMQKFILTTLRCADGIVFANQDLVERFQPLLTKQRLYYLENPIDLRCYPLSGSSRKEQALFLGAILKGKGVYDIVRAAPRVIAKRPGWKFIFCGDHELARLQKVVAEQGLTDHFEFHPWIGLNAKIRLLHESAMLLLPSYSEGFPMVVLEAMACGLPVITTPVGGMAVTLRDQEQVLFTEPRNPTMLAEKILYLAGHPDLQAHLVQSGREYVQQHEVERIMRKINAIYLEIAVNGRLAAGSSGKRV